VAASKYRFVSHWVHEVVLLQLRQLLGQSSQDVLLATKTLAPAQVVQVVPDVQLAQLATH